MNTDNLRFSSQIYNSVDHNLKSVDHTGTGSYVAVLKPSNKARIVTLHASDNGGGGGTLTAAIVRRGYDPSISISNNPDPYVIPAAPNKQTNNPSDFAPDVNNAANNPDNTSDPVVLLGAGVAVSANEFLQIDATEAVALLNAYDELWLNASAGVDVSITYG